MNLRERASPMPVAAARVDTQSWPRDGGAVPLRLHIFVPQDAPPAAGYPVLYMLDGNAVACHLEAAGLAVPVLVVAIGYDARGETLKGARAFDYTPGVQGAPCPDPRAPQWCNGGADGLLDTIAGPIFSWVASRYPVDANRQSLYGHSYGGLCALHGLSTRAAPMTAYIAASPSLWWRDGVVADALGRSTHAPAQVLLMAGEREAWHPRPVGRDGTPASREGGRATLPAAQTLAERLAQRPGWRVDFQAITGATHHTMLAASIAPALTFAYAALPRTALTVSGSEQERPTP